MRSMKVAAAQVGAINIDDTKESVVVRLNKLLDQAAEKEVEFVLFPETTFTTFFPRHIDLEGEALDRFYEPENVLESAVLKPFFEKAKALKIAVCVGYAEKVSDDERYNTAVFVGRDGEIVAKYRKIHLPGTKEPLPDPEALNQLEKKYFRPGNLGFEVFRAPGFFDDPKEDPLVGMLVCNDRRWAESWRSYALQGAELVVVGYNTPNFAPQGHGTSKDVSVEKFQEMVVFHHKLVQQAHSYTNSLWSISAARAGFDDGKYGLIGNSLIVNPSGYIVAESKTWDDELITADIDLDECIPGRKFTFDFGRHRRVEHYGRLVSQTGIEVTK